MRRRDESLPADERFELARAQTQEAKFSAWLAWSFVALVAAPCAVILTVVGTFKLLAWWL